MKFDKIIPWGVLMSIAIGVASIVHAITLDVIELKTHNRAQDRLIKANHTRSKKLFDRLNTMEDKLHEGQQEIYRELLHRKDK